MSRTATTPGSPHYVRTTRTAGRTGASGSIRLVSRTTPGSTARVSLGTLSYRCDRATGTVDAVLDGKIDATESVYVEGDGRSHLREGTLAPPSRLGLAGARSGTLVWHVIQTSEGWTLDGIVALRLGGSAPATRCASVGWTSTIGVISHAGPWTAPRGWL